MLGPELRGIMTVSTRDEDNHYVIMGVNFSVTC